MSLQTRVLWTSAGAFTPAGNGHHAATRSSSRPPPWDEEAGGARAGRPAWSGTRSAAALPGSAPQHSPRPRRVPQVPQLRPALPADLCTAPGNQHQTPSSSLGFTARFSTLPVRKVAQAPTFHASWSGSERGEGIRPSSSHQLVCVLATHVEGKRKNEILFQLILFYSC